MENPNPIPPGYLHTVHLIPFNNPFNVIINKWMSFSLNQIFQLGCFVRVGILVIYDPLQQGLNDS